MACSNSARLWNWKVTWWNGLACPRPGIDWWCTVPPKNKFYSILVCTLNEKMVQFGQCTPGSQGQGQLRIRISGRGLLDMLLICSAMCPWVQKIASDPAVFSLGGDIDHHLRFEEIDVKNKFTDKVPRYLGSQFLADIRHRRYALSRNTDKDPKYLGEFKAIFEMDSGYESEKHMESFVL
jgi:hypothetical protein